jgi:3-methyladenine DNA glycosylase AlkD
MIETIAKEIRSRINALSEAATEDLRRIRKEFSKRIAALGGDEVIALGKPLIRKYHVPHFVAYELIQHHRAAAKTLNTNVLDDFAKDLNSWWTVDAFACYLSGVAWRERQVGDKFIHGWARSANVWIRRAAVVSTVPLNNKARGGSGDAKRTLAVCDLVTKDREDMVVKALSWALRELAKREPLAVKEFVDKYNDRLAPRVRREVNTKLKTGLKNPRKFKQDGQDRQDKEILQE